MELGLEIKPIEQQEIKNKLKFKPIDLSSKSIIESYTKPWNLDCSDLSFANLFIWGVDGKMEYAQLDNVLYIKLNFEMKERYPDKFITIRYEDLVENAMEISSGLFSFLGLSFTDQTRKFIEESQSKTIDNAYTVYRKKGASRLRNFYLPNYIKQQMAQDIKKFKEAKMLGYG